ncbi:MAG TPA: arsenic resistance N-acetyltransferase ArsN2 [Thermoanaerobaculia bacterium]|nr:arsenic resistance N-acetyltransferase ArsN2 [Thermoanaerobaculia bacterium]
MPQLEDLTITAAQPGDLAEVCALLEFVNLTTAGVADHLRNFVVARDGDRLVGCGGSEAYQFAALIRSVAVHPEYRSLGLGRRLVRELLDRLSSRGLREFYLLTIDAEGWFRKRGFKTIDRDEIHPQLLGSAELQGACPDTAVCMRLVMT